MVHEGHGSAWQRPRDECDVVRVRTAILATTHLDSQGDRLTRDDLVHLVAQAESKYILMGLAHDPRIPPPGRIAATRVVKLPSGYWGIEGTIHLWDAGDTEESVGGDGRRIGGGRAPTNAIQLELNLPLIGQMGPAWVGGVASLIAPRGEVRYLAQKADAPDSQQMNLVLQTLAGIASGLLGAIGTSLWEALLEKVKHWCEASPDAERLFCLRIPLRHEGLEVELEVVLTNPSQSDLDGFLSTHVEGLDACVRRCLGVRGVPARLVLEFKNGRFGEIFRVSANGLPSVIRPLSDAQWATLGLSLGASTSVMPVSPRVRGRSRTKRKR